MRPSNAFTLFYDGDCPLCRREIAWLRQRDGQHRIQFQNIHDDQFDPSHYALSKAELLDYIHGIEANGQLIKGVDVFIRLYTLVGLSWLVAPLRWRLTRPLFNQLYIQFARHRTTWIAKIIGLRCTEVCHPNPTSPHDHS